MTNIAEQLTTGLPEIVCVLILSICFDSFQGDISKLKSKTKFTLLITLSLHLAVTAKSVRKVPFY